MNHKYIFYYIKYTMIALTYKDFGVLHDDFTEILILKEDGHRCPKQYFMNISTISHWNVFKSCLCLHYDMINNINLLVAVPVVIGVFRLPWQNSHIIKFPINTYDFHLYWRWTSHAGWNLIITHNINSYLKDLPDFLRFVENALIQYLRHFLVKSPNLTSLIVFPLD